MSAIQFYLFGKFGIETDGALISKIESRKAEELLVYLLLNRDQPQARERLGNILWGETFHDQTNNYLRKALWQLQSAFHSWGLSDQGILLVEGEWLQINPEIELWLDIAVLEDSFRKTQGLRGRDLEVGQAQLLQRAAKFYRGDLLDGWYQDWCLYERERLQHLYLAILDKLMDYSEKHDAYEEGLVFGRHVLEYDRARERTHRRLMRLYYLAGDRTAALRQYHKCVTSLKEDLDVDPADRTRRLYEMIRADKLENPDQPDRTPKESHQVTKEPLNVLFNQLSSLHKSLSQIQAQIVHDMQMLQETIDKK
jgi:DNA-binding SARP family transcriptional activator